MPGTIKCQQNSKDLDQELNGIVENNPGSQLSRTGERQVRHIPR